MFQVSWIIISLTKNINLVLFAVFFTGVGGAGQVVSTVYISEVVQDAVRGSLTTIVVAGYFAGLLISYVLGGLLSYHQVACIYLSLSLLYLLMVMLLKESPVFLVQQGNEEVLFLDRYYSYLL